MSTKSTTSAIAAALIAAVYLAACAATAPAEPIGCPSSIRTQQTIVDAPDAWRPIAEAGSHALVAVTIFDGPVEDKASLVNDEQTETASERVAVWKLAANPRGYSVSCAYNRTSLVLTRKLQADVATCRVAYDLNITQAGLPVIKSMSCQ